VEESELTLGADCCALACNRKVLAKANIAMRFMIGLVGKHFSSVRV
jgi:uncharacterized metal-binding protein